MTQTAWMALIVTAAFTGGALIGALSATLLARRRQSRLEQEIAQLQAQIAQEGTLAEERVRTAAQAEDRLTAVFSRLASDSLSRNSETFLRLAQENLARFQEKARNELGEREKAVSDLIAPMKAALEKTTLQIAEIEKERQQAFGSIRTQLASMTADQQLLQTETRNLVNALRRPQVRGQWGEITLRRVAELAGMVEHCDFIEQATVGGSEGALRPDMIVRLPDRGELVVDVKTPLDAYIEATEAVSDQDRKTALQRHARNVAERIRELSGKAYWSQFGNSPAFVILFIPGDQFLSAALSENPNLLEDALRNKVVLTTPSSLVALLKAIAYGWRQLSLERNAEEIRRLGQELYERLTPFMAHMARLGTQIDSSVKTYNDAVGSLERKVLPGARRLTELGIQGKQELKNPSAIESTSRTIAAQAGQAADVQGTAVADDEVRPDPDDLPRPH